VVGRDVVAERREEASVVERPPTPDRPEPAFALGFVIQQADAAERVKRWIKSSGLFVRSDFKKQASVERTRGVYLPAYLYGAEARTDYSAQIGENYTVTKTYSTTDSQGRSVTRTRTRTETEWRQLAGRHATYVSDRVVTASRGIPNHELEAIEPFDMRALHRFSPKIISGWAAEEPTLRVHECTELARAETLAEIGRQLERFMPGDSYRNLSYRSWMQQEHLALTLMPVWVLPVRYAADKPVVRLLVNGQTGRIYGEAPRSWVKITLLVLAALLPVLACLLMALIGAAAS